MPLVEHEQLGLANKFRALDRPDLRQGEDCFQKAIAEAEAAVLLIDDDIQDQREIETIAQHPRKGDQLLPVNKADCACTTRHQQLDVRKRPGIRPPFLAEEIQYTFRIL